MEFGELFGKGNGDEEWKSATLLTVDAVERVTTGARQTSCFLHNSRLKSIRTRHLSTVLLTFTTTPVSPIKHTHSPLNTSSTRNIFTTEVAESLTVFRAYLTIVNLDFL